MIPRQAHLNLLTDRLANFPVVAMLGPRQVGKTTLARQLTAQWCGLGVGGVDDLLAHPKCGASWEGFIIREIMRRNNVRRGEAFFWGVHTPVSVHPATSGMPSATNAEEAPS